MAKEASSTKCLIRVKNGSDPASSASPLYPQEQTSSDHPGPVRKVPTPEVVKKEPPEGGSSIHIR
jgi:hypothetical protein